MSYSLRERVLVFVAQRLMGTNIEGEGSLKEWSAPLSSEEMQTLLNLVTNMIGLEADNRRLKEDSRHNNIKVWVALTGAFATAIAAILAQIVSSGS